MTHVFAPAGGKTGRAELVERGVEQVDERRRNVGSAIHKLFNDGILGGGEMPTVGIWSHNRPGEVLVHPKGL